MSAQQSEEEPAVLTEATSTEKNEKREFPSVIPEKADTLDYDLYNLTAYDQQVIDTAAFSSNPGAFLLETARDNAQLLLNRVFSLPSEPALTVLGENGRLATLPEPTTKLPRHKPVPKPKPPTRWELFAKAKGIQKVKRSRMVYDEPTETYKPRHGYKRATKDGSADWAIPAKVNDDPTADPWASLQRKKAERVTKNKKQQSANQLAAASGSRLPGTIDLTTAVKAAGGRTPKKSGGKKAGHGHVDMALALAQHSTASMGKFDTLRKTEPAIKAPRSVKHDAEFGKSLAAEKKHSIALLTKVLGKEDDSTKFSSEKAARLHQRAREERVSMGKRPDGDGAAADRGKGKFRKRKGGGGGGGGASGGGKKKKSKKKQ